MFTQPRSASLAAEDDELLPEDEVFQSQVRLTPEEGTKEQEDDSKDGHRWPPCANWPTGHDEAGGMMVIEHNAKQERRGRTFR